MIQLLTIAAGQRLTINEDGDFFRYLEGTGALNLTYYKQGREITDADEIKPGYAENFVNLSFDRIEIYSASTQQIQFVTRYGSTVQYDAPPTGNVNLTGMQGPFDQAAATVTNASAQLVPVNGLRRYLLIQNNHATADIYLNLAGDAATTASGIKIEAGGSYEASNFAPTSAIFAIGSIASNTAIVTVEG